MILIVEAAPVAGAWSTLPFPLLAFLALATALDRLVVLPGASALGVLTTWMTVTIACRPRGHLHWDELLRSLGLAFRLILGLSLLFEFIVSAFIRQPILPLVPQPGIDYDSYEKIPKLLYWSRDLLFEGGKIQGIVGNSSLLGVRRAARAHRVRRCSSPSRTVGRFWGAFWLVVAVVHRRSSPARRPSPSRSSSSRSFSSRSCSSVARAARAGWRVYGGIAARRRGGRRRPSPFANKQLLALLGKSDDLTGRLDIWNTVIDLAQQRPAFGWGWVSYWVPWVAPFDNLVFKAGVRQLHAHNAWLDIWLQLGIVGLIVFGALVLSTTVRAWIYATDAEITAPNAPGRYRAVTLLPILLMVALLIQSLAESRLLVEYGMLLLAIIAIRTKADAP